MRHASCLNMSGECAGRGDRGDGYREVSRWRVLELWTTRLAVSRLGVAIACLAIAGESAAAQRVVLMGTLRNSCLDTISMAKATPSVIYLEATVRDSADPRLGQMADIFAQSVAMRVRQQLDARGDTVPPGEPKISWLSITSSSRLDVAVTRNGASTYNLVTLHIDSVAAGMMLRAAQSAASSDEGAFWPGDMPGDTVKFSLSYKMSPRGKTELRNPTRVAFPVFTLMVPPETPAELIGGGLPQYPPLPRMAGAIAIVTTEFLVDSAGRAMPSTFKEIWGPKDKRPTGQLLEYYEAFVSSIKRWLPSATFAPARVGGCPVPQLVSQPFTFTIGQ